MAVMTEQVLLHKLCKRVVNTTHDLLQDLHSIGATIFEHNSSSQHNITRMERACRVLTLVAFLDVYVETGLPCATQAYVDELRLQQHVCTLCHAIEVFDTASWPISM